MGTAEQARIEEAKMQAEHILKLEERIMETNDTLKQLKKIRDEALDNYVSLGVAPLQQALNFGADSSGDGRGMLPE